MANFHNYYKVYDAFDGSLLPRYWYRIPLLPEDALPKVGDINPYSSTWIPSGIPVLATKRPKKVDWNVWDSKSKAIRKADRLIDIWLGEYMGYGMVDDPKAPIGRRPSFRLLDNSLRYATGKFQDELSKSTNFSTAGIGAGI